MSVAPAKARRGTRFEQSAATREPAWIKWSILAASLGFFLLFVLLPLIGMSNHAVYILSSYLVVFVVLGGLTIASLGARARARRDLAARGLERKR